MHDPLVVAFEIPRPWPKRHRMPSGRIRYYWPAVVTVWHREPDGRDAGDVCAHFERWLDERDVWQVKHLHKWRFHVHHWKIQAHPLQRLRRRLLTRCEWCGGRSSKGDQVNLRIQPGSDRGRWWRGERGLFHGDCSAFHNAHATCTCDLPVLDGISYGRCLVCGKYRPFGLTPTRRDIARELSAVPPGTRDHAALARVRELADRSRLTDTD